MKIRTKNPKFTGTRAGIKFVDGVGETDDEKIVGQLRRLGYIVEDEPDEGEDGNPLAGLKVDELRAHAAELGVDLGDASKKADIIAVLEAATAQADSTDE